MENKIYYPINETAFNKLYDKISSSWKIEHDRLQRIKAKEIEEESKTKTITGAYSFAPQKAKKDYDTDIYKLIFIISEYFKNIDTINDQDL